MSRCTFPSEPPGVNSPLASGTSFASSNPMERGTQFLKSQVNNAVAQHRAFLRALEAHGDQADDHRFRDLCSRHIPQMREHERMLEEYQSQLGAAAGTGTNIRGALLGTARDLADSAPESDFARLVADIAMAGQAEDTFKTFREAGKMMGYRTLHEIGDIGERMHDAYVKEASRLVQHMFVESVHGVERVPRRSVSSDLEASSP